MLNASNDEEFKETFRWKNTQSLLKQDHEQKITKYNLLKYSLKLIKIYQFLKLIEKRVIQYFHGLKRQ